MGTYLQPSKSNGNPNEQAMIRKWWQQENKGKGLLVWEYYLRGCYLDAVWFPDSEESDEKNGRNMANLYPIAGKTVVLCEAKTCLTPELIGQALVYKSFALREKAIVRSVAIFAETGSEHLLIAAQDLKLEVVMSSSASSGSPSTEAMDSQTTDN